MGNAMWWLLIGAAYVYCVLMVRFIYELAAILYWRN